MVDFKTRNIQKREDLRLAILSQAGELIAEKGFHIFSMRKLASKLGCSPGTIYLYFENKDVILFHLIEIAFAELSEKLNRIDSKNQSPTAYLKQLLAAYINFGIEQPVEYHFAFMTHRQSTATNIQPHLAFDILTEAVRTCIKKDIFLSKNIDLCSQSIWVGIHGITSLFIVMPDFPWVKKNLLIDHHLNILINGHTQYSKNKESLI